MKWGLWCAGTIITKNFVITAAHCLFDNEKNPILKEEFILRVSDHNITVISHTGLFFFKNTNLVA